MSGFSQKERDEEAARRKAADLAKDAPPQRRTMSGPTARCIHCHREFPSFEGYLGEVNLCRDCLHRD